MRQKFDHSIEEEQIVSSKVKGTYRANSLFNFLKDNQKNLNCQTQMKTRENGHQVVYCTIPQKQTQDVFPGFTLNEKKSHLSIDKQTVSGHHPRAKEYSPAHATLIYENHAQQLHYRVHVFYNARGQLINIRAKSSPLHDSNLQNAMSFELSPAQKASIQEETKEYHKLLQTMLYQKDEAYCFLYKQSFKLNTKLIAAVASNNKLIIIENAKKLQAIAQKLSEYNDTVVDGRIRFLNHFLEQINTAVPQDRSAAAAAESIEEREELKPSAHIKSPKAPKKLSQAAQTVVELKHHIRKLIDQMSVQQKQEPGLNEVYLEDYLNLWQELDLQILTLELCALNNEAQFIQQQYKQLNNPIKLIDYYAQCIEQGKVAEVKKIQPIVEQANDVIPLYFQFFARLEENKPVQRCTKEWVEMAEFFFEQSGIFKQVYTMKNMMLPFIQEEKIGVGFLLRLYLNNNLPAFTLFLKHVSEDPPATFIFKNQLYGFMHALIMLFGKNPNMAFIKCALEAGITLNATFQDSHIASAREVKKLLPKESQKLISNAPGALQFDQQANFLSAHASVFAMDLYNAKHHPKLIRTLVPYASIEHLALGIARIVNSKDIITRHYIAPVRATVRCFNTKEECDNLSMKRIDNENMALFFFPEPGVQDLVPTMKLCNELLDELKHKINKLEFNDEAKRLLLDKLVHIGEQNLDDKNKTAEYLMAAQIIYIQITAKTRADDIAFLKAIDLFTELSPLENRRFYRDKAAYLRLQIEQRHQQQPEAPQEEPREMPSIKGNPFTHFQPSPRVENKAVDAIATCSIQ